MQSQKQNFWNVAKPLMIMCIILMSIIFMLRAATPRQVKTTEACNSECKKIKADVLNAVTVKLM